MTGDVRSQDAETTLLWVGFQNPGHQEWESVGALDGQCNATFIEMAG
jgi:hypothetical protein